MNVDSTPQNSTLKTQLSLWRIIPPINASGKIQMAIDRWLFEQHCQGIGLPILRFYTWEPAAISLGYHQRQIPDHWHTLTWENQPIELVKRPTGGRAVLHQGDLTYTVVLSGLPSSRMQAYQKICEFLIQGWRSLGVDLDYGNAGRGYIHNPNCFGTATAADLVLPDGSKLIGSAQLRRGNTVLQHGSIRLRQSAPLLQQVFQVEPQSPQPRPDLDCNQLQELLIKALTNAAQEQFQAEFQVQPLSEEEWQDILKLAV